MNPIDAWRDRRRRRSQETYWAVYGTIAASPRALGAADIWHETGIRSIRVFAALRHLEARGWIVSSFETHGDHPRRLYTINPTRTASS
jgi:hypothetical protein